MMLLREAAFPQRVPLRGPESNPKHSPQNKTSPIVFWPVSILGKSRGSLTTEPRTLLSPGRDNKAQLDPLACLASLPIALPLLTSLRHSSLLAVP